MLGVRVPQKDVRDRGRVTEQDNHVVRLEHEVVQHVFDPAEGARRPCVLHPQHAHCDFAVLECVEAVASDVGHRVRVQCITAEARHRVDRYGALVIRCEFEQAASRPDFITSDVQEAVCTFPGTKGKSLVQQAARRAEARIEGESKGAL
jgi:hypothetical protein